MIPRLITALIFLFCGTMTTLLVRTVLYPQGTGLAIVEPKVAFDHFVQKSEGSTLDVWDGNNIIGSCFIRPSESIMKFPNGTSGIKVLFTFTIRLGTPLLNSSTLRMTGSGIMHSDGEVTRLDMELTLPGSRPQLILTIKHTDAKKPPVITLRQGQDDILYTNNPGSPADAAKSLLVESMLKSAGVPMSTFTDPDSSKEPEAVVRAGWFEAGGKRSDGFILTNGGDEESRFELYLENTGEILRIETPLSGGNRLGLRMLSESRRPSGAIVPDLDEYRDFKLNPHPKTP